MELNVHISATDGELLGDPTHYRHIVRSLVVTRLDISYFVHILNLFQPPLSFTIVTCFMSSILSILSTYKFFIALGWLVISLIANLFLRIVFFLVSLLFAWKTKKQTTVSLSSVEAELCASALVTIGNLVTLVACRFSVSIQTPLLTDSTGVISCFHNDSSFD